MKALLISLLIFSGLREVSPWKNEEERLLGETLILATSHCTLHQGDVGGVGGAQAFASFSAPLTLNTLHQGLKRLG